MTRLLIVALTAVLALPGLTWLLARCAATDDAAAPPGYIVLPSVYDRPGYARRAGSAAGVADARIGTPAGTPIDTSAARAAATIGAPSSTATTSTTGERR